MMQKPWETVIGLEVHVQLATDTKAFCDCPAVFGAEPNVHSCPICLGQAGTLPKLNQQAVELALRAALALNCQIASTLAFDRKHYEARDLPKGYQITQWRYPLGKDGYIDIDVEGKIQRIPIRQVHLEEDAGRAVQVVDREIIDFNRAGIPLLEVVTPPVFTTGAEARAYLEALQLLLRYLGVSDCRIEEGSMRCEANISLRPQGSDAMGELCEIKNIGSFRGVVGAIAYEERRQASLLQAGQPVPRETRRWDEARQETVPMRSKEQAADYQYRPEPDLPAQPIAPERLEKIKGNLPELPLERQARYISQLGLSPQAAKEIVSDLALAAYFEEVLSHYRSAVEVANWLLTDLRALLNQAGRSYADCPVSPVALAELLELVQQGVINQTMGKELLGESFATGQSPAALVKARQLQQVNDPEKLKGWIDEVLRQHAAVVAEYQSGKTKVFGFLVGQVMRMSAGAANPHLVNQLLRQALARHGS